MLHPCLRQSPRAARSLYSQWPRLYSPFPAVHSGLQHRDHQRRPCTIRSFSSSGPVQNTVVAAEDRTPLRKQLKQDARSAKARKRETKKKEEESRQQWELTVGIEIHAQLDTEAKLFSRE